MHTALSHRFTGLVSALGVGLLVSCGSPEATDRSAELATGSNLLREANTTYWEVHVDGEHVGYLLAFDFTAEDLQLSQLDHHLDHHYKRPGTAFTRDDLKDYDVHGRSLPAGTYRILDLQFRGQGTIKPNGEVLRHGSSGADSLGVHTLNTGLRRFYQDPAELELILLRSAVAREADGDAIS